MKIIGGGFADEGVDVIQLNDNGYLILGTSNSYTNGASDFLLIKTDATGNREWIKNYGSELIDIARSVLLMDDGGFLITGESQIAKGTYDVQLIRTNSIGEMEWSHSFGDPDFNESIGAIRPTSDGGFIISGSTDHDSLSNGHNDIYIIKLDSAGNLQWENYFGGAEDDQGVDVVESSPGNYLVLGTSFSAGSGDGDYMLINLDINGDIVFVKTYSSGAFDHASGMANTSSGITLTGFSSDVNGDNSQAFAVGVLENGAEMWSDEFAGSGISRSHGIGETADGGSILVGETKTSYANTDGLYLEKLDASGTSEWTRTNFYVGSGTDQGNAVKETADGGYIVVGTRQIQNDVMILLVKTKPDGSL